MPPKPLLYVIAATALHIAVGVFPPDVRLALEVAAAACGALWLGSALLQRGLLNLLESAAYALLTWTSGVRARRAEEEARLRDRAENLLRPLAQRTGSTGW